jgi:hypothetical protein
MKISSLKAKLILNRETLRGLSQPELTGVDGGSIRPTNISQATSCVHTWCGPYSCYCTNTTTQ